MADLTAGTASAARMMPTASVMVSSIRENPARRFARMQLAVRRVAFECVVGICTFSCLPASHRFWHVAGEICIATCERKVAEGGVLRQLTARTVWAQSFWACIRGLSEQQTEVLGWDTDFGMRIKAQPLRDLRIEAPRSCRKYVLRNTATVDETNGNAAFAPPVLQSRRHFWISRRLWPLPSDACPYAQSAHSR